MAKLSLETEKLPEIEKAVAIKMEGVLKAAPKKSLNIENGSFCP